MKKLFAILMAVSVILTVSACSKGDNNTDSSTSNSTNQVNVKSCENIYDEIDAVIDFPTMVSVKEKSLSSRYGIEQNMYSDYVFMTAQEATLADTVVIIKSNSADSKDAIIEKLNSFVKLSQETNVDYNPDQYDIIKNSSVKTQGDYVYLVFSTDMKTIEKMITDNIK